MPFDYTSGNPDNLVGGSPARMQDIQGPLYDIRAYLNTLLPTVPTGALVAFAGAAAPAGYLMCDGSPVSRTGANAALFAAIGTVYGAGDGSTTFNLPDLRGRVPVGGDPGAVRLANAAFRTLGQGGGEEKHALAVSEVPALPVTDVNGFFGLQSTASNSPASGPNTAHLYYEGLGTVAATQVKANGGVAAASHNVMQPGQIVNYVIKL